MMAGRDDCIDDILKALGGRASRERVNEEFKDIEDRARDYEGEGFSKAEAYQRARDEKLEEISQHRAWMRRNTLEDARKTIERHRYYDKAPDLATGIEAKIAGVNNDFPGARNSTDAKHMQMSEKWQGGFVNDLERGGLFKLFASRSIEADWARELFEINKGKYGSPGVTKNEAAATIAQAIHRWQKVSINAINRAGGFVRTYSGYITRTSHDADRIKAVGPIEWAARTFPRLDLKRTFGTADRQRALDALHQMWTPLSNGDHFDYGRALAEEPIYPNVAKQASASRELHFKSADDWLAYNKEFGAYTPTHTVMAAFDTAARRTALLADWGSKPREALADDINYAKATLQRSLSQREQEHFEALRVKGKDLAPAEAAEMAKLREKMRGFSVFESRENKINNLFAQVDGSSMRPVNRLWANLASGWMSIQRMSKLGRVVLTHVASLFTKTSEANYWGIPLSMRYGSLLSGLTRGAEGSEKRQVLELLNAGLNARVGFIAARFDHADTPRGVLSRMENYFFRATGISSVTDKQRADSEAMFARWLGMHRGKDWSEVAPETQRVLRGFGLGEAEWKLLHKTEWTQFAEHDPQTGEVLRESGNHYLLPPDALKLSDADVRAYMVKKKPIRGAAEEPSPQAIGAARENLARDIATLYDDRGRYAIIMHSAKTRAALFGGNYKPGSGWNIAAKVFLQFKIWPAEMITRVWGREIYGRAGDGGMGRAAAAVEAVVGAMIFGTASEAVRELIQGRNSLAEMREHPIAALMRGAQRAGIGTLAGDFLLGQYDRHGMSPVASLAGPTFGQIDRLVGLYYGTGEGALSAAFGQKTGEMTHPWREAGTNALKIAKDNMPFMNLWATGWAFDHLVLHELQEWMNPGYLRRSTQRMEKQGGVQFLVSPQRIHEQLHGH